MSFVYILAAILIFGVLIAVHELGHFLAAKLCGVQVNEFSIGMGPAVWHRKKGETAYSFRILPIGGYCAMEGEDERHGQRPGLHPSGLLEKIRDLSRRCFHEFPDGTADRGDPVQPVPGPSLWTGSQALPRRYPGPGKTVYRPGIRSIRSTAGAPISAATPRCF